MNETKYIWQNGKIVKWKDAKVHVLSHGLHYGTSVFEGIRLYKIGKNKSAIFRLDEHIDRLFYSAKVLEMKIPYSKKDFKKAIIETCAVNKVPEGYIRPIIFYGYGKMSLHPFGADLEIAIALWPWGSYLSKETIDIMTSKIMRNHPNSLIPDAKVSGHYVNSILSTLEITKAGFDEAILLDYKGNVAEGPGENIFYVKNKKIFTVKTGNILPGITRDSVIIICKKELGIDVIEKDIKLKDLSSAEELFFTGTAAEIQPIASIDRKKINNGKIGETTKKIQTLYMDIVHGNNPKYNKWLSEVK